MNQAFSFAAASALLSILTGCAHAPRPEIVEARAIRLVDAEGKPRLELTSDTGLSDPKGSTRKVRGAGIIFYDDTGHEVGGVGLFPKGNALCFDYPGQPHARGEAICVSEDEGSAAGISVEDPRAPGDSAWTGNERLALRVEHGQSKFELSDKAGKPRIRVSVDANDVPRIEVLDAKGAIVYSLPPSARP